MKRTLGVLAAATLALLGAVPASAASPAAAGAAAVRTEPALPVSTLTVHQVGPVVHYQQDAPFVLGPEGGTQVDYGRVKLVYTCSPAIFPGYLALNLYYGVSFPGGSLSGPPRLGEGVPCTGKRNVVDIPVWSNVYSPVWEAFTPPARQVRGTLRMFWEVGSDCGCEFRVVDANEGAHPVVINFRGWQGLPSHVRR